MVLNDAVRQALTTGNLAHMITINPDGSPQVSVVWVDLDGDEIVMAHLGTGQKMKNIQRDPRVTISMQTGGRSGVMNIQDEYLVIKGRARITEGGGPELLTRLADIYVGPGSGFPPLDAPAGHIVRITAERISGVGPWK